MIREQAWPLICYFREVFSQHGGDARMKLTPPAPKEHLVGGVLKKGMLEEVNSVRWRAATVEKLGLDQGLQRLLQPPLGKPIGNLRYHFIRKFSAERRTNLRYLLSRARTI